MFLFWLLIFAVVVVVVVVVVEDADRAMLVGEQLDCEWRVQALVCELDHLEGSLSELRGAVETHSVVLSLVHRPTGHQASATFALVLHHLAPLAHAN